MKDTRSKSENTGSKSQKNGREEVSKFKKMERLMKDGLETINS